ncbi:MAG: TraB/GumN family protein [Gammaproteobacteria bacterium]|nr:TraB/GumN family protein [Gammaproteobacteria bacterium]
MKNYFPSQQLTKSLLLPIVALQLAWSAPAIAYKTAQYSQPDIRYIDRSKGERNRPFSVSRPAQHSNPLAEQQAGSPMLWRIEQPGTNNGILSSYIFGTIHIDNEKVMAIPDNVVRRLAAANTLMLELELNASGSVNILRKMLFTDGRNLEQVIGETEFKAVTLALSQSGNQLPGDILSVLKPWAAMLLLIRPENKSGTFLDKKLADIARNSGIRIEGLETIDEQLSVFDDLLLTDQVNLLRSTMSTLPEKNQAYRDLLDAYLSGNLEKLIQVSTDQEPKDKKLARLIKTRLIYDRNQKMFDRMQQRLQAGNTFVAIGALHLPGELGLLNKLKQAGYRLSRIGRNE